MIYRSAGPVYALSQQCNTWMLKVNKFSQKKGMLIFQTFCEHTFVN